ncbi:sulfate reduction electron transfer complex DsrMKJOP subunit DsrJ [Pseudodesulfovibrio tunisiensis]|uniref:sulfate reduction electron transfer complex DsrMKJOP subunit DsrJ n=1 Tax=Pseudodesulfovibrio tunisiensis TaxID=463192 RepID=UPI001FB2263B|nr:sulfate reduction electron transfer complex DsrMKJOP subunit DsrJ [Pseudodesulfovibrio tunisiensis]
MKMQYGAAIVAGLVVFFALLLSPFVVGKAKTYKQPELKLPVGEKQCIESTEFMRREHMQLLNDWRDWALRDGKRTYINHAGKEITISLQNTCMKCHNNKAEFCDKCHDDAGVSPYCWDCHIQPEGLK